VREKISAFDNYYRFSQINQRATYNTGKFPAKEQCHMTPDVKALLQKIWHLLKKFRQKRLKIFFKVFTKVLWL